MTNEEAGTATDEEREEVVDLGETSIVSTLPIRLIVGGAVAFAGFVLWRRYR